MRYQFLVAGLLLVAAGLDVSAQQTSASLGTPRPAATAAQTGGTSAGTRATPALLPGTRSTVFSTIQGEALNSTNGKIPNAVVRLRDARYGHVVETTTTDALGAWSFKKADPGSYVVELMGPDQTVTAATQIINVNAGETITADVKLPFRIPPFGGLLLLGASAPSAAATAAAAAGAGVLATTVTGEPISPPR